MAQGRAAMSRVIGCGGKSSSVLTILFTLSFASDCHLHRSAAVSIRCRLACYILVAFCRRISAVCIVTRAVELGFKNLGFSLIVIHQ